MAVACQRLYAGGEITGCSSGHPAPTPTAGSPSARSPPPPARTQPPRRAPPPPSLAHRMLRPPTITSWDRRRGFLGLPHGNSGCSGRKRRARHLIVDCGADFRLTDADDWTRFYGSPTPGAGPTVRPLNCPAPANAARGAHRGARLLSDRGRCSRCFRRGRRPGRSRVTVVAVSGGTSGGTAAPTSTHWLGVIGSARAYNIAGAHRHPGDRPGLRSVTDRASDHFVHPGADPDRAASWPPAPPAPNTAVPDPGRLRKSLRRRVVRPSAARGGCCHDRIGDRQQRRAGRGGRRPRRRGLVAVCAIDNLVKGTAGRRCSR